jgi:hypothetical protein
MKFYTYLITFSMLFSGVMFGAPAARIVTDAQALAYCKQTPKTYITVVWPRGYTHLDCVVRRLNKGGSVAYVKKITVNREQLFALYRAMHPELSYGMATKYFGPYTQGVQGDKFCVAVLVFKTKKTYLGRRFLKERIRAHIGARFYSIHMNDFYKRETVEAAQVVFK